MKVLITSIIAIAQFTVANTWAAESKTSAVVTETAAIVGTDFKPIAFEDEKAPVAETASTVAEESTSDASAVPSAATVAKTLTLKENEIPVLTKAEAKKAESGSPWARIGFSFLVIGIMAAGLFKFSKTWKTKVNKTNDNNKIRVLNQHYLGPRKSLAIIRVAGETILIGVTDQNISHIKSLALLEDEEVSNDVPQNFAASLKSAGVEDTTENDSAWTTIRDRVSTKLKEMRPL